MNFLTLSRRAVQPQFPVLAGLVALAIAGTALADVIYLKDGFAAHGKVKKEMELIIDPATGQMVPIVKASNCFLVDDRVRYVVFGPKQVDRTDPNVDIREGHVSYQYPIGQRYRHKLPKEAELLEPKPFTEKWERVYPIRTPGGMVGIKQRISILTPYFVRVESLDYDWTVNYQTREFGPDVILPLLKSFPKSFSPAGQTEFDRRFKVARFCMQAGWFTEAKQELADIARDFPNEQQRLDVFAANLRQLEQQALWDETNLSAAVGRHARAIQLLKQIQLGDLPGPLQADAANLKTKYDAMEAKLRQARQAFAMCFEDFVGPHDELLAAAVPTIISELNFDTMDRVDAFATVARQMEQDIRAGRPPKQTFVDALTLAISAWVLGPEAAEASMATADRLWTLRERLLAYQRTIAGNDRFQLMTAIEQDSRLSVSEIARAITLLPPPEEPATGPAASQLVERKTSDAFTEFPPYSYHLLMPAEYHPNRAYPLLIVLPAAGQGTAQAIEPWIADATRHGYIVACVDWGSTIKRAYEYKPIEHAAAQACLRDVKRFAHVDSDRVFLAGYAEGGNMAIDVGLAHPDLFAGVVPINGRPRNFITLNYWRNGQNLPFYIVIGELTGAIRTWDVNLYENWAEKGFPSLMVMYRGRAAEFFPGEVPNIFDWMDRQRRSVGFPELGKNFGGGPSSQEYVTQRSSDNRFYWITTDQVDSRYLMKDPLVDKGTPAGLKATINGNQVNVNTRGLKHISLWFGRAYDAQTGVRDMIDFTKPIKIQINGRINWTNNNKPLEPKLETLLDDYYRRADRRRLFFARVDFDKLG
jgi:pimeloyl-ACP methyl ester carboxylesterase